MTHMHKPSDERGVVSILTVLFFVILLSVLTVAFLRIMSDEQEQVIGDDLTKGALASARSGVEDAKRALLYCRSLSGGPDKVSCENALKVTTCPGIFGSPSSLTSNLGIVPSAGNGGATQVGGKPELNQRYTCLKINRDTPDVTGVAQEGIADLIELDSGGTGFDSLQLEWHRLGNSYDGVAGLDSRGKIGSNNPQTTSWSTGAGTQYPALLRVQLLEYDPAANLTALAQKQATAFFVPSTNGDTTETVGPVTTGSGFNRSRYFAKCTAIGDYSCSVQLNGIVTSPGKRYFVRLSTKYRSANYRLQLKRAGVPVAFHDVQPEIDSTGAAGDTYRRVLTRVEYGSDGYYTDNALESGESVCKSFYVTSTAATGVGSCTGL